jgi:hypothetical protein
LRGSDAMAEYLFGFAFLAYAGAAIAYAVDVRRPGPAGRLPRGVCGSAGCSRLRSDRPGCAGDGFPWTTWAGWLNLFVWLVVSVYLVWGCRTRYRLLGLVVMPLAVVLLVIARLGGGTGAEERSGYSTTFLVVHVGLLSFAFAAFTLAAALSALPVAGAAAEEPPARDAARPNAVARHPRDADRPDDRRRAAGAHRRDRRRLRPSPERRRSRGRADGGHARHLGGLRLVSRPPLRGRLARPPRCVPALVGFAPSSWRLASR